jgi:hypothetical protein
MGSRNPLTLAQILAQNLGVPLGFLLRTEAPFGDSPFPGPRYFPPMLSPRFKSTLDELARGEIFIGTSSWKYPGWCGQLYDEQRYLTRNKFSETKFERECLMEYAQTVSTVCVDATPSGAMKSDSAK